MRLRYTEENPSGTYSRLLQLSYTKKISVAIGYIIIGYSFFYFKIDFLLIGPT